MEKLIKLLHEGNHSCVVGNFDEVYTFDQWGIADLYDMVKNKPCFLKDACVADKVVGKAAAALMILGEIKELYADVISLSAVIFLREAGIEPNFAQVIPFIWNQDKTDCCPLERMCSNEPSAQNILSMIETFINDRKLQLNKNRK
ncbi:MAG: DUF1893 domain-containing protein [Tannerellaceae bacterium]|nr:DUF1893 domain-containing protein [Tannerellaceae bacterium]